MGQEESIPNSLTHNSNWREIGNYDKNIFPNVNPYSKRIFQHITTREYVEEYELQFISELDFSTFQHELEMRREINSIIPVDQYSLELNFKISPYIYRVKGVLKITSDDLCTASHRVLLYAEKVDLRLREINDIPFAEQLYLTQATLEGFKSLYQNVGYFDIIQQMIFINRRGRVKVWMNPNIANHQPYIAKSQKRQQRGGSQSQMIIKLLGIIEENTDNQLVKDVHFRSYLAERGTLERLSFYKALEEFKAYCLENRLCVPKYMASIRQLYEEEEDSQSVASMAERSQVVRISVNGALNFMVKESFSSNSKAIKKASLSPNNIMRTKPLDYSKISQTSYRSYSSNMVNHNLANQSQYEQKRQMVPDNSSKIMTPAFKLQTVYYSHLPTHQNQTRKLFRHDSPPQIHLRSPVNQAVNQINQQPNNHFPRTSPVSTIVPNFTKKSAPMMHQYHILSRGPIKFSYNTIPMISQREQTIKMETPQFKTINSFPSEKTSQDNETDGHCELKQIQKASNINYYSANQMYQLDQQIANDLKRFLAFSLDP